MDGKYLDIAKNLKSKPNFKNYYLSQDNVDKDFLEYVLKDFNLEKAQAEGVFDKHYFTVALPVADFSGRTLPWAFSSWGKKPGSSPRPSRRALKSFIR